MITANELRIGNCVNDEMRSRIVSVDGIEPNQDWVWVNYLNGFGQYKILLNNTNPIPISPEILEKCEFDRSRPILWIEKDYPINLDFYHENSQDTNGRDEVWVYYNNAKLCDVQYLHQLQNLYFALTGEELEVKL